MPRHALRSAKQAAPEPKALAAAADLIAAARKPVIIAEFVGGAGSFHALASLPKQRHPCIRRRQPTQLPTRHPLNMSMAKDVFRDADLVSASIRATGAADHRARERHAKAHLDRVRRRQVDRHRLGASSSRAGLSTTSACTTQRCASSPIPPSPSDVERAPRGSFEKRLQVQARRERERPRQRAKRAKRGSWAKEAARTGTQARSCCRARLRNLDAIKDEDWVLTANTLEEWTRKLWDFDKPYRIPGARSAPRRSSAFRSAWRLRTGTRNAWSSTFSPTET